MRAAVIGAGHIARQHLQALIALGVERVAICDRSAVAAEAAAERYGVARWFVDHRQLLDETRPDVVHVATPPGSHFALARDALEAGAHVIVEKPITLAPEELGKLIELAKQRQLVLLEDHNYRFNRTLQRVLEWIRSGELGEVVHVDVEIRVEMGPEIASHPSLALPGGIVAEYLSHMAYLSNLLVGEHRGLHTLWRKLREGSPLASDEFRALVDAERGTALLSFSANAQPGAFTVRVHGSKRLAEAQLLEPRLTWRASRGPGPLAPALSGVREAAQQLRGAFSSVAAKLSGGPGPYEGLWEFLRRSYAAVESGEPAPVTVREIEAASRLFFELCASAGAR